MSYNLYKNYSLDYYVIITYSLHIPISFCYADFDGCGLNRFSTLTDRQTFHALVMDWQMLFCVIIMLCDQGAYNRAWMLMIVITTKIPTFFCK